MAAVGFLITDGGPHSAEKWAVATASHIVSIAEHVSGEKRSAAIKLEAAIIDILEGHHTTVHDGEHATLAEIGHDRLTHSFDPEDHVSVDHVVSEIIAAAKGTPWAPDFDKPEMAESLRVVLNSHFSTSMHAIRSWHADQNADAEQSVAFKNTYHPGE